MSKRFGSLVLSLLVGLIGVVLSGDAQAQTARSVTGGSAQFYIGGGLPIPVRPGPWAGPGSPVGTMTFLHTQGIYGVPAHPSAQVTTTGGVGGTIKIQPGAFTLRKGGGGAASALPFQVQGVMTQNPVALQVGTNFTLNVPASTNTLKPGAGKVLAGGPGRTGPDVLTWCPGSTATVNAGYNPVCVNVGAHMSVTVMSCPSSPGSCPHPTMTGMYVVPGSLKYKRTGSMLGGPGSGDLGGTFDVAVGLKYGAALFVQGTPPPSGQQGMAFGSYFQNNVGRGPNHAFVTTTGSGGLVIGIGPQVNSMFLSNRTTYSFGAPQTQGYVKILADTGTGTESYVLNGYDNRTAGGSGVVQLVSGSIGKRSLTGENANRGLIKLNIGAPVPEPAMIAGAVGSLLVLAGCHLATRRRK